jgi:hypothetical protein
MSRRHTKKQSHRRRHQSRSQHRHRRTTRGGGCGCGAKSLFNGGAPTPLAPAQYGGSAMQPIAFTPLNGSGGGGELSKLIPTQTGGGGAPSPLLFTPLQNPAPAPAPIQSGGSPAPLNPANINDQRGGRRNRRGKRAAANQKGGGFFDNFSINPIMGFLQSYGTSGAQSIMYGKSLVDPNPSHQNLGYSMGNPRIA